MSDERGADDVELADREAEVGAPVVRGDPEVTGRRADEAVGFDPTDPDSVAEAADTVARFAREPGTDADNVVMLRGAAACAALVRGTGSYKAAVERAGDGVSVSFVRKWARVHDLPQSIRRHVARGDLAPTAAKHVARVDGEARFALAWAALDDDLTVREVQTMASAVNEGADPETVLREHGVEPGRVELGLPFDAYRRLRVHASMENRDPGEVVADALDAYESVSASASGPDSVPRS
ncbi:DUF7119 family protein [Candidatus Halobonum tyrrellensis]|uniref:DUF7119 domain-containing protein n=1 Tax=Candidatus Halobonum tyrrellensis G22 TaxID=1324957 RepID=V4H9F2_9EURY|nr:hypothetical protein [Candidatus Halobonum tyrrellensis]ESP87300.1 hypothetical protein K933_14478 [Candidatus Halobonum tyrrellensis G22]